MTKAATTCPRCAAALSPGATKCPRCALDLAAANAASAAAGSTVIGDELSTGDFNALEPNATMVDDGEEPQTAASDLPDTGENAAKKNRQRACGHQAVRHRGGNLRRLLRPDLCYLTRGFDGHVGDGRERGQVALGGGRPWRVARPHRQLGRRCQGESA